MLFEQIDISTKPPTNLLLSAMRMETPKNRLDLYQFWRTRETINLILIMGVPRLCSRKLKNIEGLMFTVC